MLAPLVALSLVLAQNDDVNLGDLGAVGDMSALSQLQLGKADPAALLQTADHMLPRVAKVMGVAPPSKVKTKVVSREEASRKLLAVLEREYPGDKLQRLQTLLQLVHLVEPGVDLGQAAHAMYSENVSGFYDHKDRVLYLLEDQPAMAQGLIIAHELAHAIQDERLGIDHAIREQLGSEDGQLALSAALEGNAQAVSAAVLAGEASELLGGTEAADMMTELTAGSAAQAAQDSHVSAWLGLQLSFPYAAGAGLVKAIRTSSDPGATAKLLSRPPVSTAQVMDPDVYRRNEKPLQGRMGLARQLSGASLLYETTLGRANIELFGEGIGEGWRGDHAEAVVAGGTRSAAWVVAFAEASQAERFATAYAKRIGAEKDSGRFLLKEKDRTFSSVKRNGATVVVLSHAPQDKVEALETVGFSALH